MKQVLKKIFASVLVAIMLITCTALPESLNLVAKAAGYIYSEWGAWSEWQDDPITETDLIDVGTQQIPVSVNYKTVYHYYRYADVENASTGYPAQTSSAPNKYCYSFDSELEETTPASGYTRYKWWYSDSYWRALYADTPYTTEEFASYNYKTQYRYRTRTKIYCYEVAYDANGGTGAPASQMKPTGEALTLSSTIPTKNYTVTFDASGGAPSNSTRLIRSKFNYWRATDGTRYNAGDSYNVEADTKLTAQWTDSTLGALPIPTKAGHTFVRWSIPGLSGGQPISPSTVVSSNLSLSASWRSNFLTVYYNANGGSISSNEYILKSSDVYNKTTSTKFGQDWTYNQTKTGGLEDIVTLGLYRTGYTFAGWGTNSNGGTVFDEKDESITPTTLNPGILNSDQAMTLYAQWVPNTYTIKFDGNGCDTGSMTNISCIYDNNYVLPTSTFSKKYHGFAGWNTKPDGSGTTYADGTSVQNLVSNNNGECTLYAQWKAIDYLVTFNVNGGETCDTSSKTVNYDICYGTLPTPIRHGYKFLGWFDSLDSGTQIKEDTVVSTASNHTLYAHWEEKPVTAISVDLTKSKTTYYVGDTFSPSNVVLTVKCDDGEVFDITKGFECSTPTLDKVCKKRVTVKYKSLIAYYTIDVVMAPLQSISVKNPPNTLSYSLGDIVNTEGLVLHASYTNGYSRELTTGYETTYDFSSSGNKTVVVSYTENNVTKTTSYRVTVENVPKISSDVTSAYCGEIVSVPVYISNNSGIMGFGIEVSYDKTVLTPVSVTKGTLIDGFLDDSISTSDTNSFMVYWTGSENVSNDGIIFTIDFLVADNAYGETIIGLNYSSDDTFDEDWNDVKLVCDDVTLNVSEKDSNVTKIIADNCSGKVGTRITIPVKVIQNNGLNASTISLEYDTRILSPIYATSGLATISKSYVGSDYNSYNFEINEISSSTGEGTLLSVKFDIDDCAPGEYEVKLSCSDSNVKGGTFLIKVLPEDTKIYGGSIIKDGDIITVPVNISGNYGMMGLRLNFTYDASVMEPVSATPGKVITSGMTEDTIGVSPAGTLSFIWIGNDDITGNGELLLLKFKMLSGTTGSKISIDYSVEDTYNSGWENVDLLCKDVSVVYEIIPEGNTFINFVNNFIITKEVEKTSVFGFLKPSVGFEFVGLPSHMAGTTQFFGTGSLIYVYKNGAPQYPLTLVVEGDVNGDSVCDALDAAQVALVEKGHKTIDGAYKMAADNNADDEINIDDYQAIVNKAVS